MGTTKLMRQLDEDTWKELLSSYEFEYKDLSENWKIVESKAQSTITLASALLAASFATAKELPAHFSVFDRALLCAALLALALCLTTAVYSLRIRFMVGPPVGSDLQGVTHNLSKEATYEKRNETREIVTNSWRRTNGEISRLIVDKASLVGSAQVCLAWAGAIVCYLTISSVIG